MPYMNKVYLTGHLVAEPEMRYVGEKNSPLTDFRLAVDRSFGDKTDFFTVNCWNRGNYKLAEYVAEDAQEGHLPKGKLVTIVGEVNIDKSGDKWYTKINADKVIYDKKASGQAKKDKQESFDNNSGDEDFDVPF